jgi:isopenicillin-N epimerase
MTSPNWTAARAAMLLDPAAINLNTGSFGPLPRVVFERVTELRRRLAEEPMDFLVRQAPPLQWEARERLAAFLGGDPRRLVLTVNVTTAVNLVAASLTLAAPGEILITDHEYGAMHWCWERAALRLGLTLRLLHLPRRPAGPGEIVTAAKAAFTDRTRLFFFSHVLSPTGMVLPARDLCAEARRRGILTMVDGAHAPALLPLQLDEVGADYYGGNGHKWLLAPTNTGFLYFAAGAGERLLPLQTSWGWHSSRRDPDLRDAFGSTPRLRRLEFEGVRDPCPWLTLPTAIDFQAALGWDAVRGRIRQLSDHVRRRLTGLCGLEPATPDHAELRTAMTAFRLPPGSAASTIRHRLWHDHRIEAPVIDRPDGLLLRVSTHFYNTEEEVDRLAEAMPKLLA